MIELLARQSRAECVAVHVKARTLLRRALDAYPHVIAISTAYYLRRSQDAACVSVLERALFQMLRTAHDSVVDVFNCVWRTVRDASEWRS